MPARRRDLCRPSTNHQKEDSLCTITPAPTAGRIWTRTNAVTASPASVGNPQSGTAWTACGRGGARGPAVSALKLGSLFDGIGVFPLAASRCGIVPVWASEIARAPVSITKRHFPEMLHLGDITQIDGGKIPPVDVVTFGSPCQNLSQIGNRTGLAGSKSGLFYQAMRIIEEMRNATDNRYPAFAVWENVAGAFVSNDRLDFAAVLHAFTGTEIPMPDSGIWAHAGMVRGGRADTAWRLMDAQYWGEPALSQRRRRSWRILQENVPQKYYLSPAVCSRILRLAAKAGCPPPAEIEYLLLKQGGRYPSCVPSSSGGCGQWQSRAIKKVSARVSAETANPSQLCLPV